MPRRTFAEHQALLLEFPFTNIRDEQAATYEFKKVAGQEITRLTEIAKADKAEAEAKAKEVQARYDDLEKQARRLTRDAESGAITYEDAKSVRQAILREQRNLYGLIDAMQSQLDRAAEIQQDPLTYHDKTVARFPMMRTTLPDWSF